MILKDDANTYNSLYALALRWARADSVNFPFEDFIQSLNVWVNKITAIVLRNDVDWKWQDKNATGTLIDSMKDLADGTSEYPLSTPWLKIARVRIKDREGIFYTLEKRDRRAVSDAELISSEICFYYLLGNSLFLAGVPNYSQTDGIEVQFQAGATHFTPDDEDKEVGFDSTFEELGALGPALDYLEINGPDEQAKKVSDKIGIEPRRGIEGSGLLNALALAYQERDDAPQNITLARSNRALGLL